jgi:hypothetical protein
VTLAIFTTRYHKRLMTKCLNLFFTDEVQQGPKKRGRKPKIPSQTIQSTIDKGGRPPLVRHALVYDTVEAVAHVRRSQRNKKDL